jgi:predicted DNA-binding transcriptional regulator AlpA
MSPDDFSAITPLTPTPTAQLEYAREHAKRRKPAAPAIDPLLVDAAGAGAMTGFSRATWWKLQVSGRCPAPIRCGRKVLWRVSDLRAWAEAGCPPRDRVKVRNYLHAKVAELERIGMTK